MKNKFIALILTGFFFVFSLGLNAQSTEPTDPGSDPEGSNPEMGGGAPIGGGTLILIALGAAYGGKKVYKVVKENHEELES